MGNGLMNLTAMGESMIGSVESNNNEVLTPDDSGLTNKKRYYVWKCCNTHVSTPSKAREPCGYWSIKMSKNPLVLQGSEYAKVRGKKGEIFATCYNPDEKCGRKKRLNADNPKIYTCESRAHAEKLQAQLNSQEASQ